MFTLRTAPTDLRSGITRRDALQLGLGAGLGAGLSILCPDALAAGRSGQLTARNSQLATPATRSFGRAKACILVYLFGGPSHVDMWDMKPEAPDGIRGEFKPIGTNVDGLQIAEHLPRLAKQMDRWAVIRSLTHGDDSHGSACHTMLTGRKPRFLGEVGPDPNDSPHYGAVLDHLRAGARGRGPGVSPVRSLNSQPSTLNLPFVSLPWSIATSTNHVPGQDGGFLGQALDPFLVDEPVDLRRGFDVPLATLSADEALPRMEGRRRLLRSLKGPLVGHPEATEVDKLYGRAFQLLDSADFWRAFRLEREADSLRERYGMNLFGQSLLLARRLVQVGAPCITVYWPDRKEPEAFNNNGVIDKVAVAAWDTHGYHVGNTPNFPRLKDHNLPPFDLGITALMDDLAARGMLDDTLVIVTGEFGRSPKINADGGRDHYGRCFSAMLGGGGIRGGVVHGASDATGAEPASDPVTPGDFSATLFHCLGLRPETPIIDRLNQPHRIADGEPVRGVLI